METAVKRTHEHQFFAYPDRDPVIAIINARVEFKGLGLDPGAEKWCNETDYHRPKMVEHVSKA